MAHGLEIAKLREIKEYHCVNRSAFRVESRLMRVKRLGGVYEEVLSNERDNDAHWVFRDAKFSQTSERF